MIEWVLSVAIAFSINGQTAWVKAQPEKAVFASRDECVAAGRALKTPPGEFGVKTRVRCTTQHRPGSTIIMPPYFVIEEIEP